MADNYDVVIIGGTLAGRYAADRATKLGAKVALVEPVSGQDALMRSPLWNHLYVDALTHLGQISNLVNETSNLNIYSPNAAELQQNLSDRINWTKAMSWVENVVANLEAQNSPAILAALGVDVIQGNGQFEPLSPLTFIVNKRQIQARAYLIATNSRPSIPNIEGLQTAGYVTATNIWRSLTSPKPPKRWVILGSNPLGIQLAQTLTRLGCKVILIARRSHILPQEDPEIAHLVQAILEAEGVCVLTKTPVIQVKQIQDTKWIQAGDQAIETDEILLATRQVPNIDYLNLEAVGVQRHQHRLSVNEKLQTTNSCIYACGEAIGGYQFANIANYEAEIALKNALFSSVCKVDYRSIPWAICSQPQLARVGLTEAQARRSYSRDVLVLRQYFKTVAVAQLKGEITGICKLIILRNGEILGATIVGSQAGELINVIALAIAQKVKINAIATLAPVNFSWSEILAQTAATSS